MTRALAICLAVYVPHLVEEALTQMHDDRLIVTAFGPLEELSARHASYLVFQIMMALMLVAIVLVARGGRSLLLVAMALALGLLCEAHHVVRALATLHYDSGLFTSLPMPFVGAWLALRSLRAFRTSLDSEAIGAVFS